jgi:ABC-2 type transport system ATP-binding protein
LIDTAAGDVVVTRALGHTYGEREALRGVDLTVEAGEIFGLLGPNGSGKSTLFKILATLMKPTRGTAEILGHDVSGPPWFVRRSIGVAFQSPSLDGNLSVRENLLHQGHLHGWRGAALRKRIDELLDMFRLGDRASEVAEKLSGGLARRVDLAKALLHAPPLVLLDEPSTGLDPSARRDLWTMLDRSRRETGTTCLITTHLMEEAVGCDRVAILDQGQAVAAGRPDELTREIGGDVITLTATDAAGLAAEIRDRFDGDAVGEDGAVRLERENGATFLPDLLAAFPGRVTSSTVASPTLEDVFFHRTGRTYRADEETP